MQEIAEAGREGPPEQFRLVEPIPAASLGHNSDLSAAGDFWHLGASKQCKTLILACFECAAAISDLRVCTTVLVLNTFSTSIRVSGS